MKRGKKRYSIGEVAKISDLNIKTLRYYDDKKILVPELRNESNNYRYYSEKQILDALMIREMKLRGYTLSEMQAITNADSLNEMKISMEEKLKNIDLQIEELNENRASIYNSLNLIINSLDMYNDECTVTEDESHFEISDYPERYVIYTKYKSRILANELFWDRYAEVYRLRDQVKANVCGPFTAVFHDHYTRQFFFSDGTLEAFVPITNENLNETFVKKFGGFKIASKVYVGHYKDLLPTYIELVNQIEKNGYVISGPAIEEYIVEFSHGATGDRYVTRVCFPVEKRR